MHFDEFEPPITKLWKKFFNPLRLGNREHYRLDSCCLKSLHTRPARDMNRNECSKVQGRSQIAVARLVNSLDSDGIEWDFETKLCFRGIASVSIEINFVTEGRYWSLLGRTELT